VRLAKDNSKFNSFPALPPLSLSLSLSAAFGERRGGTTPLCALLYQPRDGNYQITRRPRCDTGEHAGASGGRDEGGGTGRQGGGKRRKECVGGMCGRGFRWIQVTSRWRPMMLARARARLQVILDPSPFLCPFQLPAIFRRAAAWNPLECVVRGVQLCPRVISSRTCATERQECWRVSRDGRPKVISCLLENIIA